MLGYDTAEDRALIRFQIVDLHRARAAYQLMSLAQRRAYAAAHPEFSLGYNAPPESIMLAIADAYAAGEPDRAAQLASDVRSAQLRADIARALAAQRVGVPERVVYAGAWGALTVPLAGISALTGYAAAGPHGALVAAIPPLGLGALAIVRRLLTGSR